MTARNWKGIFLFGGVALILFFFLASFNVQRFHEVENPTRPSPSSITLYSTSDTSTKNCSNSVICRGKCVPDCLTRYQIRCLTDHGQTERFTSKAVSEVESTHTRQAAFERVYHKKEWINAGDKIDPRYSDIQGSGAGSTLEWAQEVIGVLHVIISELKQVLNKDTISILDIPCGDMVWMNRFLQTRSDIEYVGMDIVPRLISHHTKQYARFPKWSFVHQDIVALPLNRSFDLIFCRMMLQHLALPDVGTVLQHFSDSGSRYLLTTTFPHKASNPELAIGARGRFRFLNLEIPPFSLRAPICMSRDGDVAHPHHYIALWELPLQRHAKCSVHIEPKPSGSPLTFHTCS